MNTDKWIEDELPNYRRLTNAVISILESILQNNNIEYLSVTGRTKSPEGIREKIKRKNYKDPINQVTDISGIRVILYFETDVDRFSKLISSSFCIDEKNSSNKNDLLLTDRVGYRSTHFVCDLGSDRNKVPEYGKLSGLKFELQVRTVLQHAWAELSHDREYKFSGVLPNEIQRKLFLYSGLLEIADRGFAELSAEIDEYAKNVKSDTANGKLDVEINSISLKEFFLNWTIDNKIEIKDNWQHYDISALISEIKSFGLNKINDLNDIIPKNYAHVYNEIKENSNILGIIRDWMLINDHRKLASSVQRDWQLGHDEGEILKAILPEHEFDDLCNTYSLWE